jgi:hypothetical protein
MIFNAIHIERPVQVGIFAHKRVGIIGSNLALPNEKTQDAQKRATECNYWPKGRNHERSRRFI